MIEDFGQVSLRIENATSSNIVSTYVPSASLNTSEWGRVARPDLNFNYKFIKAGEGLEKVQEISWDATKAFFSMTLSFANGTKDTYHLNLNHASDPQVAPLNFDYWSNHHHMKAWREGRTIYVRVENTKAQKENHLAKNMKEEADLLIKQRRYEEAPNRLREALGFANEWSTRRAIRTSLARIHHYLGAKLMHRGDDLQMRGEMKKALRKYEKAKAHFEKARKMKNTEKYANSEKMITLKIEGNQIFDKATKLGKDAFELSEKKENTDDCTEVQNKYKEALAKYKEALKKYEEGAKIDAAKFGFALNMGKVQVQKVKEVIIDVDGAAPEHLEEEPQNAEDTPRDLEERFEDAEDEAVDPGEGFEDIEEKSEDTEEN